MNDYASRFAANLTVACATRVSISEFCREIDINRQQFNRYINGSSTPSRFNRQRIAAAFGLESGDFDLPSPLFRSRLATSHRSQTRESPLADAFTGDTSALRPYVGFYQLWHISMSYPQHVVCSCAHLRENNGQVIVTSLELVEDAESGIRQRSRYDGLAAFQRNRIFITEVSRGEAPTFGQTILSPFEIHQRQFLRGLTMGVSWRHDNLPYATRTIWRHRGRQINRRALVDACGIYARSSAALPSPVIAYLSEVTPLVARF